MEQNTHKQTKQGPYLQSRKYFTDVLKWERMQKYKQINNPWLIWPKTWNAQVLPGEPGCASPAPLLSPGIVPWDRSQPGDLLGHLHPCVTVGRNWDYLSLQTLAGISSWHVRGSQNYFEFLGTAHFMGRGCNGMQSIELSSLLFPFENVFYSSLNSNQMQMEGTSSDEKQTNKSTISNSLRFKLLPHFSKSCWSTALLILTANCGSQPPILRMEQVRSKHMLLESTTEKVSQMPHPWSNSQQRGCSWRERLITWFYRRWILGSHHSTVC